MNERATAGRGEATREALIRAATHVFGRDGFSAATTKTIAREAGANQALISYHFGGKEGLYAAVIERIVEGITRHLGPLAAELEAESRRIDARPPARGARSSVRGGDGDAETARACFELLATFLDAFADMLTAEESAAWAKIIVREQQEPSAAFEILYAGVQRRILDRMAGLVARINGRRAPGAADRLTVLTIVGQVLVFRVARAAAVRYMGWETMRPRDVSRVKRALRSNVAAMLGVEAE